jgi:mannose-1-phosphate guanylyltransferase
LEFAVIMSGGSGRRFWPLSRAARAKQLIRLIDGKTLLELTVERVMPLFPPENIIVVTEGRQYAETSRVLERFAGIRILSEPASRNTAACIAYAATFITATEEDAVLSVLPADHFIAAEDRFREVLAAGMDFVGRTGNHLTLGIKPDRPATGFGYIKRGSRVAQHGDLEFFSVTAFTEKPSLETARAYLETGDYLWNAGIFVFRASSIIGEIQEHLPDIAREFDTLRGDFGTSDEAGLLAACYANLPNVSIDYGVMEHTDKACVVPVEIGWDDVGNWDSFAQYMTKDEMGNAVQGDHLGIDTRGCVIYSDKQLVGTLGVSGIIVIATDDAVLVMRREKGEEVKQLVTRLEEEGLSDLL